MVAKITTGKSIRGMLLYNENKVNEGEAKLILSSGFAVDIDRLDFQQKLQRFQHLTELKPNVKTNALHISLNFSPDEKLSDATLQQIASSYMQKIGFGEQPFLVYRHDDAAHQHLHITTTNINSDGQRMDLHDIGKKLSEPARKQLEIEFGLVKAEAQAEQQSAGIKSAILKKVTYGKLPTKAAIRNVVTAVTRDYRYTSLAEYNAALKCFNVVALRGAEHTAMFQRRGLMFSILDEKGKPVGVPIKASELYNRPTLNNLERRFSKNTEKRKGLKAETKARVEKILSDPKVKNLATFETQAAKQGITVNFRQNDQGLLYGITFIDHKNKTVFNGSDLDKGYSAKGVTSRFENRGLKRDQQLGTVRATDRQPSSINRDPHEILPFTFSKVNSVLDLALAKTQDDEHIHLPRRKRRKRRKNQIIQQDINL